MKSPASTRKGSANDLPFEYQFVGVLKGVGPSVAVKLEKLGIFRVQDLLFHLPLVSSTSMHHNRPTWSKACVCVVTVRLATVFITDEGANIENVDVEDRDGLSTTISYTITVHNRDHLACIIRRLRKLPNVLSIQRA